jgi:hypothetical protein
MDVPVLIVTYKRVDFVLEILDQLASRGMKKVYLSVDDYYHNTTFLQVENHLVRENFDFKILKWDKNVGCDRNVMEGINWFFQHEERGIILEDDCIPVAGFELLADKLSDLGDQPVSFFSTNTSPADTISVYPSYLPIYWGWYCTRKFYHGFYKFYTQPPKVFVLISHVLKTGIGIKIKLIALINYFGHRAGKKRIAWDSELFIYLLSTSQYFLVPSVSFIDNKGFGETTGLYTHTSAAPGWYRNIDWYKKNAAGQILIEKTPRSSDRDFLDIFFSYYTDNKIRLLGTFVKTYLGFITRSRKSI